MFTYTDAQLTWATALFSQLSGMTYEQVAQALADKHEVITTSVQYLILFGG